MHTLCMIKDMRYFVLRLLLRKKRNLRAPILVGELDF